MLIKTVFLKHSCIAYFIDSGDDRLIYIVQDFAFKTFHNAFISAVGRVPKHKHYFCILKNKALYWVRSTLRLILLCESRKSS